MWTSERCSGLFQIIFCTFEVPYFSGKMWSGGENSEKLEKGGLLRESEVRSWFWKLKVKLEQSVGFQLIGHRKWERGFGTLWFYFGENSDPPSRTFKEGERNSKKWKMSSPVKKVKGETLFTISSTGFLQPKLFIRQIQRIKFCKHSHLHKILPTISHKSVKESDSEFWFIAFQSPK